MIQINSILKLTINPITLSIALLLFLSNNLYAQCPEGNFSGYVELKSQSEIDNFIIEYPNCTEFPVSLGIGTSQSPGGPPITNLDGLSNIVSIGDGLSIFNNTSLSNLDGLNNLSTINGRLDIRENTALTNLEGLDNLTSIIGTLIIYENSALTSLAGINNLTSLGGIYIYNNPVFTDLSALNNITSLDDALTVQDNVMLTNLYGFSNIVSIGEGLTISYNASLTSLEGLNNLNSIGGLFDLHKNDGILTLSALSNLTSAQIIRISDNDGLTDLEGLNNIGPIVRRLTIISHDNLMNIEALNNITTINEFGLEITGNAALSNLEGLNNLTSVNGGIWLGSNAALNNITALNTLTSIGGYLAISHNDALNNLDGLENITAIDGFLTFRDNDAIINIDALNNLTFIGGDLTIRDNEILNNIDGLNNVSTFGGDELDIYENPLLSNCSNSFTCETLLNNSWIETEIHSNAFGCNVISQIFQSCDEYGQISYPLFYDVNENGLLDGDESFLPFASVVIDPDGAISYGNSVNGGLRYVEFGDYNISYNQIATPIWELTTPNTTFDLTIAILNPIDTVYFGLIPTQNISDIQVTFVNDLPRCNEHVIFEAIANNQGTTITDGIIWLNIDEEITDVQFIDTPDYEDTNRYGWDFENLFPGNTIAKQISLQLPGPPELQIGEILFFNSEATFNDLNGQDQFVEQSPVAIEVQCAYDPNDKLVQPSYPENYSLIGEDLIYTIRFQNTGNAEAYDVVITDKIDSNLDLSTFRVITSSHEEVLRTFLKEDEITFEFRDIFLPDSTTNFDASQGYVMYSIKPLQDMEEFTIIQNTANIFFDFNPPIITNTTENNMVLTFDHDEDDALIWDDCDDYDNNINPDGIEIANNDIDEDCDGVDLVPLSINDIKLTISPNPFTTEITITQINNVILNYSLHNHTGHEITTGILNQNNNNLAINNIPAGIYFLKILDTKTNTFVIEKMIKL